LAAPPPDVLKIRDGAAPHRYAPGEASLTALGSGIAVITLNPAFYFDFPPGNES
jgi:hypothetical protein